MIALATKYENIYVDTSAYKLKRYPDEFVEYLRTYGSDTVLFGTTYPMIQPGTCLRGLAEIDLDESVVRQILYENAERVFDIAEA